MPPSFELEAEIRDIGMQGDGVTELNGNIVHVPFTAPGDIVRLRVTGSKGEVLELLRTSEHRKSPSCQHFGPDGDSCGGCSLQHLQADYYLQWKGGVIKRALQHEGLETVNVLPVIASPFQSRRRASFALLRAGGASIAGFHRRQSHQVVDLQECLILRPSLFEVRKTLASLVLPLFQNRNGLKLTVQVTEADNGLDVELSGNLDEEDLSLPEREHLAAALEETSIIRLTISGVPLFERIPPVITFGGLSVPLPSGAFLQATSAGEAALQAVVMKGLAQSKTVVDLFSGCGTFTFIAAQKANADAFENDPAAIAAILKTAPQSGNTVTAIRRDLFRQPLMVPELSKYDTAIIDPPRAGAEEQVNELARSDVQTIISVSCNPKTFARDAALLVAGGYQLNEVQPVDQFTFSPHIEVAAIFKRE